MDEQRDRRLDPVLHLLLAPRHRHLGVYASARGTFLSLLCRPYGALKS